MVVLAPFVRNTLFSLLTCVSTLVKNWWVSNTKVYFWASPINIFNFQELFIFLLLFHFHPVFLGFITFLMVLMTAFKYFISLYSLCFSRLLLISVFHFIVSTNTYVILNSLLKSKDVALRANSKLCGFV